MTRKQILPIALGVSLSMILTACGGGGGGGGSNNPPVLEPSPPPVIGTNPLELITTLEVGHEECRNGGEQTDAGIDTNSNDQLDSNEIDSSETVCNASIVSLDTSAISENVDSAWYTSAADILEINKQTITDVVNQAGQAKNIILFVGDGMGISTVTAARILAGQRQGGTGEEYQLSFGKFPFSGFSKTYSVDAQTPDSAGTMTAMMTGVKTNTGLIGVGADAIRGDCASVAGNRLVNALELAEIAGKSTGVVTTARLTHATPAAAYAHSPETNWEDISDMPASEVAAGCEDIASQLLDFEDYLEARFAGIDVDGLEVAMGGGRRHFLPNDAAFNSSDAKSAVEGDRTDGRDLTAEWQTKYPTGKYVIDQASFDAIDPETTTRVLGLFNESHMQYEADRDNDIAGEPSLTQMTEKAIAILDNNSKGFFLTVESGRIDHAHSAGNAYNALNETIEFANAIEAAVNNTNPEDTLIIVTADHSHVFTIAGYPKRGNPILGKVVGVGTTALSIALDGKPFSTVGYTNGRGFMDLGAETNADVSSAETVSERVNLTEIDTQAPGFHQEALVPTSTETHAGEDVGVYASGPSSQLVRGTYEQSYLFHVMTDAANLIESADAILDLVE